MPVKGVSALKGNLKAAFQDIADDTTERALTKIMIVGQSNADAITPIDTANLINSGYRDVRRTQQGWQGVAGYTANYAESAHDAPGVLLGTRTPRNSNDPSRGYVWDPDGEPQFLVKGFERDGADEIQRIILQEYRR